MNLLITGAWGQAIEYIPLIEDMGHAVTFLQQEKDALPCPPDWVEGVICNGLFLSHPIEVFSRLRYIQLTSAGFDRVPMEFIRRHGITIHNARDVYSVPMAEHAVACALWFYRALGLFRKNQQAHLWEKRRDLRELMGKTVLIVGFGSVGRACAERFSAMGCRVTAVDRHPGQVENGTPIRTTDELDTSLKEADIIVLSVPLTAQTLEMIDDHALEQVKDGALLINVSRGKIVETGALLRHLPRLMGAALDVFEEEPLPSDSPLWNFENVLITPHNSFAGDGNEIRLNRLIMRHLANRSE